MNGEVNTGEEGGQRIREQRWEAEKRNTIRKDTFARNKAQL